MQDYPTLGRLIISLGTIQENYRAMAARVAPAVCAAVVKANAYGLGLRQIAPALADAGARDFFVALITEGIELRSLLPDVNIYILNGFLPGEESVLLKHSLVPVLNDPKMLQRWQATASETNDGKLKTLLHVDTGMNRLGFNISDFEALLEEPDAFEGLDIQYVMSHMACADTPDHELNSLQREEMKKVASAVPHLKTSLAASYAVFLGPDYHFDMVRVGAALYGINPTPDKPNPMKACIQLYVPILQIRTVDQDGSVGYGATCEVKKGQHIASVSLGYADGFSRILSNKGKLFYKGHALPVIGSLSMDIVTVDISSLTEDALAPGDMLEVFGPNQMADDLASAMGTIGYEVMTSLGRRFERVYK